MAFSYEPEPKLKWFVLLLSIGCLVGGASLAWSGSEIKNLKAQLHDCAVKK